MRFLHIADLHIGKRIHEASLLEEQEYILQEILDKVDRLALDGVLMAGDIYDKAVPSAEAVDLFDRFLHGLAQKQVKIFIISGNHDSPERVAFGAGIMSRSGIFLAPVYRGMVTPITLKDQWGEVDVFLLPFVKPAHVKRFFPEADINSYNDAIKTALGGLVLAPNRRRVLVTHQFITGAVRSESEDISVGGTDNVDAGLFADFDYVALGHLHGPQFVGRDTVRYCGTPLKYSFSEAGHEKSLTVVELREAGAVEISTIPLTPRRDMRIIRGCYDEITAKCFYEGTNREDYLHVILTDEEDIPEALGKLRSIYPHILRLEYDNKRTRASGVFAPVDKAEQKDPMAWFSDFYRLQNGQELSEEQRNFLETMAQSIWGNES